MSKDLSKAWNNRAKKVLLGKKIVQVEYVDTKEANTYGWHSRPISFTLNDQTRLIVMCDDEGNDGGALCYLNDNGEDLLPVLSLDD